MLQAVCASGPDADTRAHLDKVHRFLVWYGVVAKAVHHQPHCTHVSFKRAMLKWKGCIALRQPLWGAQSLENRPRRFRLVSETACPRHASAPHTSATEEQAAGFCFAGTSVSACQPGTLGRSALPLLSAGRRLLACRAPLAGHPLCAQLLCWRAHPMHPCYAAASFPCACSHEPQRGSERPPGRALVSAWPSLALPLLHVRT